MEKTYLREIAGWTATPFGWIPSEMIERIMEYGGIFRYEHNGFYHWGFESESQEIKNGEETKTIDLHLRFMNFELALRKAKYDLKEFENTIKVLNKAISYDYGKKHLPSDYLPETEMEGRSYGEIYEEFEKRYPEKLITKTNG